MRVAQDLNFTEDPIDTSESERGRTADALVWVSVQRTVGPSVEQSPRWTGS